MTVSRPTLDLQVWIDDIAIRSAMYVGDSTFKSAALWLDGFVTGFNAGRDLTEQVNDLKGFRDWLAKKFYASHGIARNLVWWCYLTAVYPDDKEAFNRLAALFAEYKRDPMASPTPSPSSSLLPGEGIRRSAGGWSDDPEGLDNWLIEMRHSRDNHRPEIEECDSA